MNRTRIVIAGAAPEAEPRYLIIDELGSVVGRGVLPVQEAAALTPMRSVLVIPGAEASARWLPMRAGTELQARAAAMALLEDHLAQGDGLHVAVGPESVEGERLVCAISAVRLQAALDHAALHGVTPQAVLPDHLALAPPPEGAEAPVRVADLGDRWVARGARLAVSGEPELVETVIGEAPVERLSAEAFERALAQGVLEPPLNLLQGPFDPDRQSRLGWRDLRRAGALAAAVLISPIILLAAQALSDHWRAEAAEARTRELAAAILPAGEALTDPAPQVEARLASLAIAAGGGGAGLLAQLYAALEPMPAAQLENFILMPDGTARAAVSLAAYPDMERLGAQVRGTGLTLREEGSREEAGRVIVDIVLGAR